MKLFRNYILALLALSSTITAMAGNKIKVYFNHSVDITVSSGTNAVNLNGRIDDTLIAYIDRAKYTLDVAVYNFTSNSGDMSNVANAINSAYSRGVKVRWIMDGSSTNSGAALLNAGINKLRSPTTGSYTIMHNKFMVVDANSSNPNDAVVWTGSTNWSTAQFNTDFNNIVVIQDSALAHVYRDHFNMMWGDTGIAPNSSASRFGSTKTDLGRHNFTIDGKQVEVYFSPADNTGSRIISTINTARTDLYWGMYTFTYQTYADAIMNRKAAGVYVAGINDAFSHSYTPYNTFNIGLGSMFKEYTGSGMYHNKYLVVDPSDTCSDPAVLTGSHNWSFSANTDNDENTLIIHDASVANQYYQSFKMDFMSMGGSVSHAFGCPTAVYDPTPSVSGVAVSPNPARGNFSVSLKLNRAQQITISMVSIDGKTSTLLMDEYLPAGYLKRSYNILPAGVYIVKVVTGNEVYTERLVNE